ncbi:MAG: hypothetical protein HYW71_01980 [Candidatus Niyogibacteria bacterium]|nr:hypothetical protein [Candidatus Niyogibacteria bacterium]
MAYLRFLFLLALVVLFVGTSFSAIFGGGKLLTAVFKAYVLKVETCRYDYISKPLPVAERPAPAELAPAGQEVNKEVCKIDYNDAKRDIAEGLAMMIIAAPIAFLLFRKIKEYLRENQI